MDAGAFSDDKVVKAGEPLVFVLVDCTEGGSNGPLKSKFSVRGFPTMVFCDPDGKQVGKLGGRNPESIASQFKRLAEEHGRSPWIKDVDEGIQKAKKEKKPVLALFGDKRREKETRWNLALLVHKDLEKLLERFVLVRHDYEKRCKMCKKYKVSRAPIIYIFNPNLEKPEKKPISRIWRKKSPKQLKKALEWALKKWTKALKKSDR